MRARYFYLTSPWFRHNVIGYNRRQGLAQSPLFAKLRSSRRTYPSSLDIQRLNRTRLTA